MPVSRRYILGDLIRRFFVFVLAQAMQILAYLQVHFVVYFQDHGGSSAIK
jgi:hypothetical protein